MPIIGEPVSNVAGLSPVTDTIAASRTPSSLPSGCDHRSPEGKEILVGNEHMRSEPKRHSRTPTTVARAPSQRPFGCFRGHRRGMAHGCEVTFPYYPPVKIA